MKTTPEKLAYMRRYKQKNRDRINEYNQLYRKGEHRHWMLRAFLKAGGTLSQWSLRATALALLCLAANAAPPVGLQPNTNPPPATVSVAWDADTDASVVGYFLYSGPATRFYTNKVDVGTNLMFTVSNLVRGVTNYFAVTGYNKPYFLESAFSNEASYAAPIIPSPTNAPGMRPIVVLTVQSKTSLQDFMWADTGMSWSVDPNDTAFYRLDISRSFAVVPQLRKPVALPPLPR